MELPIYQIDAFADKIFEGNPAAVCPLDTWLADDTLQKIAMENALSETAFFVKENNAYHIRWFTPLVEVALCGHATLASAHVIFEMLGYSGDELLFQSKSGELRVSRKGQSLVLDFPVTRMQKCKIPDKITESLGKTPVEVWESGDYMAVYETEADVRSLFPDFVTLAQLDCRGLIATARGQKTDFVSRFFAPRCGVNEDPVTGSAHCALVPYWAEVLGKSQLTAAQLSTRGGLLACELAGERVLISGKAVKYMEGNICI